MHVRHTKISRDSVSLQRYNCMAEQISRTLMYLLSFHSSDTVHTWECKDGILTLFMTRSEVCTLAWSEGLRGWEQEVLQVSATRNEWVGIAQSV
jgi:hypothetical protein